MNTPKIATCLATLAALFASSAHAALVISSDATSNVSCSAGVCAATAADAVLNVSDVTAMLAAGSLTVQSGSTAQDILVEAPFSWTSANALTLDSFRAITVDKPVSDAGPAALSITYNDGGTGGELLFRYKGRISFTSTKNALAINGQSFRLVKDIASLASAISDTPSGSYALEENYNAKEDGIYGNSPITTDFAGNLEGMGNTISNLVIDRAPDKSYAYVALFTRILSNGAVKNLRLTNINYLNNSKRLCLTGGLVGFNIGGYLYDDHITGTITSNSTVGGLAGANASIIRNSSADVAVTSTSNKSRRCVVGAGGLIGVTNGGAITSSFANGNIKAPAAGGLIGIELSSESITDSYATGDLRGKTVYVGGFIGSSYDTSAITSFSIGQVPKSDGGFIGSVYSGMFSNCYWDTQTSGTSDGVDGGNIAGITGLKTKQFKAGLPYGFDPKIWAQDAKINGGYPYLIDNPPVK